MQKQIMIIGLGQFGMSLAKTLTEKDAEVFAIDIDPELVDEAATFAADAICLDATDETALTKFHPEERDAVICAIGEREASILCTALLRQMGVKFICSRYLDDMHERVLKAVGANVVINPEREIGRRFANRILFHGLLSDDTLDANIQLNEICVPDFMVGKNLTQLALPDKYGIIVAAIKHGESTRLNRPMPNQPLAANDKLLLICTEDNITRLLKDSEL